MGKAKYIKFFNENVYEDQEDILTVCEVAGKTLYEKFKLGFIDPETKKIEPRLIAVCFTKIFGAILQNLKRLEKEQYSSFEINICNRLIVGFSTNDDDDDEKQGNFMIFINHINGATKNDDVDDPSLTAQERSVQWNAENVIIQPEIIKQISVDALKNLKEIEVTLASADCIMPIFVTVYEALVNYLKVTRREKEEYEYEINFASCFTIGVRESDDGIDAVYFRPSIESKLALKNDSLASSKYE